MTLPRPEPDRRSALAAIGATVGLAALPLRAAADEPALTHGPFVGHVDETRAHVWFRAAAPGAFQLRVRDAGDGAVAATATGDASEARDLCVAIACGGLAAGRRYRYEVLRGDDLVAGGEDQSFATSPAAATPARTRLVFGSCAHDRRYPKPPVWKSILELHPDGIVLLGDTPYIDSTELGVQRRRYREFYANPDFAALLRQTPSWATWDDHDFGGNDADGRLPGKERSRRAFVEYHAPASAGHGDAGIYTSFRRGPVEVFLLDTRWFAQTGASFADPQEPTLLGLAQWEWLRSALRASTAAFKLLACGMVWNGSLAFLKADQWSTYPYERDRLWSWIGEHRIPGVVLVGGDIHRSRAFRHRARELAGYDLTELITSPLANETMAVAKVPSLDVIADGADDHSFLVVDADASTEQPTLLARALAASGRELFRVSLDRATLTPG